MIARLQRLGWSEAGARTGLILILAAAGIVSMVPFYYLLRISLETNTQYYLGEGFSLATWANTLGHLPIFADTWHSIIVTLGTILLELILSAAAGYAFAKLRPPGHAIVFIAIIGGLMIPLQSILVPEYLNLGNLGLVGTYGGAILVYAALGLPFAVFLMTSHFRGIPDEILDAGLIDGLSYYGILVRLLLPLAVPAMVAVGILQFIGVWNDLLIAMLWLPTPQQRTITVGLATTMSINLHQVSVPTTMAASLAQAIPAMIAFLIFQKSLVKGLTVGVSK